jgi:hypothetical protein
MARCPGGVDTWPPLRIARRGEISTEAVLPATDILEFNELAPDFLFLIMVSQTNSRIVMAVAGKTASVV